MAEAIIRASPRSAILAHCQLTFNRNGVRSPAVVHIRVTSRPGASAVSGLHSQTRPSSSTTRRDDIVSVSIRVDPRYISYEMEWLSPTEVTATFPPL
jgi:hypothetical protein